MPRVSLVKQYLGTNSNTASSNFPPQCLDEHKGILVIYFYIRYISAKIVRDTKKGKRYKVLDASIKMAQSVTYHFE